MVLGQRQKVRWVSEGPIALLFGDLHRIPMYEPPQLCSQTWEVEEIVADLRDSVSTAHPNWIVVAFP